MTAKTKRIIDQSQAMISKAFCTGGIYTTRFCCSHFSKKYSLGLSEAQLFPRPTVDLLLYLHDETVAHHIKISAFWDVLPNQLIGILYSPFLPRAITVRKIDGSS